MLIQTSVELGQSTEILESVFYRSEFPVCKRVAIRSEETGNGRLTPKSEREIILKKNIETGTQAPPDSYFAPPIGRISLELLPITLIKLLSIFAIELCLAEEQVLD